jgi:hypothetical protein
MFIDSYSPTTLMTILLFLPHTREPINIGRWWGTVRGSSVTAEMTADSLRGNERKITEFQ